MPSQKSYVDMAYFDPVAFAATEILPGVQPPCSSLRDSASLIPFPWGP